MVGTNGLNVVWISASCGCEVVTSRLARMIWHKAGWSPDSPPIPEAAYGRCYVIVLVIIVHAYQQEDHIRSSVEANTS